MRAVLAVAVEALQELGRAIVSILALPQPVKTALVLAAAVTPGSELQVPEGFQVDCLYTVPRVRQGSWVSLTSDPAGRLLASDQYGDLYRITLPPITEAGPVEVAYEETEHYAITKSFLDDPQRMMRYLFDAMD